MNHIVRFALGVALLGAFGAGRAADYYVTAQGAGAWNGRTWDDGFAFSCYTGFKFLDCDDTVVRNCFATRYSQQGFFFGKQCDRVLVQNCEADGSPGGILPGDVNQVGFQCKADK